MYSTEAAQTIRASRSTVYRALVDPAAIAQWRVPDGMRSEVHEFDGRAGGRFRISLHYASADGVGKTAAGTDTYAGHFAELVPDERVVEVLSFETADRALDSPMTLTTTLREVPGGTEVVMRQDGIPDAIPAADNAAGTRMALAKLARLVEQ